MFDNWKITLASNSPRRKELLSGLGIEFSVEPSKDGIEAYSASMPHFEIPAFLARHKSETFHRKLCSNEVLITADTLVFLDDTILGKPGNPEDARLMLRSLSGKSHTVITGVALRTSISMNSFSDMSEVTFRDLSEDEILYYIKNFNPLDKAGSYGIQDWIGLAGISSIKGSYFNVMGLPTHRIYEELQKICK